MKKALIVIDMQNDFIDGALCTKEAMSILPYVEKRAAEAAKEPDTLLVFTQDTHKENYLDTAEGKKLPVPHCIKPQKGWEIAPSLTPYAKDAVVIEKPTFGSTELPKAVKDCDEFILLGLCTDICVISNAMLLKAFYPERPVKIDAKGCAGVTPESHNNALEAMKMCQIEIIR